MPIPPEHATPPSLERGVYCDRWPVAPATLLCTVALSTGEVIEFYAPERLRETLTRHAQQILEEADERPRPTVLELLA